MQFLLNPNNQSSSTWDGVIPIASSHPSPATEGYIMINSSTNTLDIYYSGTWFQIYTFIITASYYLTEDGFKYELEDGSGFYILE